MMGPRRLLAVAVGLGLAFATLSPTPSQAQRPAGLAVVGWVLDGAGTGLVDRNADGLSTLSVVGVTINATGDRVSAPTDGALRLLAAGHDDGLASELLVSNYSNRLGDFDPAAAHALVHHPDHAAAVADRLAGFVADQGWDGVDVDLERVRRTDADGLADFVAALRERLPEDRTVSIDISASSSVGGYRDRGYDLARLAGAADTIAVMTYDLHGPTWSRPGPIGPLDWQRRSVTALTSVVPAGQVRLGVAGYGYSWPRGGTGRSLTLSQVRRLVARHGAEPHWRAASGEWTARLPNGTVLWWSDGRSYRKRIALARELGVGGLAVWRLGSADTLH